MYRSDPGSVHCLRSLRLAPAWPCLLLAASLNLMEVEPEHNEDERGYLQDVNLFGGFNTRMMVGGQLEASEVEGRLHQYLTFFNQMGGPDNMKSFALVPIWRLAETNRHVDELNLHISHLGNHYCTFNGKDAHGTWVYNQPATPAYYLDVKFNARFGERHQDADYDPDDPDNDPDNGKWTRFQRIPGTATWIRCEPDDDHTWTCVLAPVEEPVIAPVTWAAAASG